MNFEDSLYWRFRLGIYESQNSKNEPQKFSWQSRLCPSYDRRRGGPGSDGLVYSYARNYATVLTIDGELFVNGEYYGRVLIDNPVSVVLASGRVFVDGIRRPSQPYPDGVADRFFGKTENAKVDWTPIMGWPVKAKVLVRDSRIAIGGGGRLDRGVGPYVLGMNQDGAFFVWGIPYGPIQEGDTVEVYRDRVLVNGKVQPPTSVPPKK